MCFFTLAYYSITICLHVFFHIGISSGHGSFLVSWLRGTQRARPSTKAQVWALAEVRGTCSGGSKSQETTGGHSKHVEPSRHMQTHVQVKRMFDGSCDI